jgi:two-component system, OmpR family, response regulator
MKVLLIDDDADIRRLAAAFLSAKGKAVVVEADSGEAGVAIAERERPDVILLDAVMPGMDGPQTLAELRRQPGTASTPVIFLTATARPEERDRLAQLGVRGVLSKPFNPATLADAVRALLDPEE